MRNKKHLMQFCAPFLILFAAIWLAGCQTSKDQAGSSAPAATASAAPAAPKVDATIRIKAGITNSLTDSEGHVWMADQGFADGDTIERPDVKVENTKTPELYRSEHYSMTSFSRDLPNGKYTVKLHFAETYEDISAAGQRVFSFSVAGHEFKDFDVFAKAGGAMRAYVQPVDVNITNGKLEITFTSNIQNPEINAIEIIPAS